jgi:hypothetical protein
MPGDWPAQRVHGTLFYKSGTRNAARDFEIELTIRDGDALMLVCKAMAKETID